MMRIFSMWFCVILSACTTVPALKQTVSQTHEGLSAQTLSVGECGVFLWSVGVPRTFVFFHEQEETEAKFYYNGVETSIAASFPLTRVADMAVLDLDYTFLDGKHVEIQGQFSDGLEGGRRITSGTIQTKNEQEWQEIIPVSGVYACR